MQIASINNYCIKTSFGNSKSNQDNYIEKQTKQVIRDNFDLIQNEAVRKASHQINNKHLGEFIDIIEDSKKKIHPNDVKNIFKSLQGAYKDAGMQEDANALGAYIDKIS